MVYSQYDIVSAIHPCGNDRFAKGYSETTDSERQLRKNCLRDIFFGIALPPVKRRQTYHFMLKEGNSEKKTCQDSKGGGETKVVKHKRAASYLIIRGLSL